MTKKIRATLCGVVDDVLLGIFLAVGELREPSVATSNNHNTMAYRFSSSSGGGGRDDTLLSPILLSTAATLGASIVVQLATPADPWGKSLRFLKQLGRQVRYDSM